MQTAADIPPMSPPPSSPPPGRRRWIVVALLLLAMIVNYVDRQTLGLLKPAMSAELGWSNSDFANIHLCFQAAYALCYLVWGRVVDRIGARAGFALAFALWSLAQLATAGARQIGHFMLARLVLGVGESGAFPGSIKAIAEWFPQKERALANGLFNAGTNIGAIITPLAIPAIVLAYGWQAAFVVSGLAGLVWLPLWLMLYRNPRASARLTAAELRWIEQDAAPATTARVPLRQLLGYRQTWTYALAKFMTDPVFGMYLVWLPDFLAKRFHLDLKTFGPPLIAIYVSSDVGSVFGGWLSSRLLRLGWGVNRARKTALLVCALCATPVVFAAQASNVWVAVALIGLAAAAHQGFSANLYALPPDLVPRGGIASVVGIGGALGACGGMLMSKYTGWTLDADRGYAPIFLIASCAYLAALAVIHFLSPRLQAVEEGE
jgi:ACS family hexuronate transporter-like MFS transporter